MTINGREVKFRRTVYGNCKIAEICPDKDINQFNDLLNGDYVTSQNAAATFIAALSEGHEMWREYEDPGYKGKPITKNEALMLGDDDFGALFTEALNTFQGDGRQTVEAEEPKELKRKNADGDGE